MKYIFSLQVREKTEYHPTNSIYRKEQHYRLILIDVPEIQ